MVLPRASESPRDPGRLDLDGGISRWRRIGGGPCRRSDMEWRG